MRKRHIIVIILGLLLGLFLTLPVMAEETSFVTEEQAYDAAVSFIRGNIANEIIVDTDGDLYAHGHTTIIERGFPEVFAVREIKCLYDSNQNISAYYMPVIDVNNRDCGYVIVSADKNAFCAAQRSLVRLPTAARRSQRSGYSDRVIAIE